MRTCVICNRTTKRVLFNKEYGDYLCREHANHYSKYKQFFKWNIYFENEYEIKEDYVEIILRSSNMIELGRAIIDIEDLEKVIKYKWNITPQGYARNCAHNISLHQLIIGKKENAIVDHEDRNRLNCRKYNLRHTDYTTNGINKGKQSNNTSGHVGVSWDNFHDRWEANIKINRKKKFLGYFKNIEDAVEARLKAEIEYFGYNVDRTNDVNTVFKNQNKTIVQTS